MKLATLRTDEGSVAVRIDDATAVEITGVPDIGALLAHADWRARAAAASGPLHELVGVPDAAWAPVVPEPSKIVCVGLNYRNHILEMGRDLPEHPTLFAKYPEALVGARQHTKQLQERGTAAPITICVSSISSRLRSQAPGFQSTSARGMVRNLPCGSDSTTTCSTARP